MAKPNLADRYVKSWTRRLDNIAKNVTDEVAVGWTDRADREVRLRAAINEYGDEAGKGRPPARRALGVNVGDQARRFSRGLIKVSRAIVHKSVGLPRVSVKSALQSLQRQASQQLTNGIKRGMLPVLAASTLAARKRKGRGSTPLIDTGKMLDQANAYVRKIRPVKVGEMP